MRESVNFMINMRAIRFLRSLHRRSLALTCACFMKCFTAPGAIVWALCKRVRTTNATGSIFPEPGSVKCCVRELCLPKKSYVPNHHGLLCRESNQRESMRKEIGRAHV